MAEKNTLSILEAIKKKIHKIDNQNDKDLKISESDHEFEYLSQDNSEETTPASQEIVKQDEKETNSEKKLEESESQPALKLIDPFEDIKKLPEEQTLESKLTNDEINSSELQLEDLDLDDEISITPKVPPTPISPIPEKEVNFGEDDLEDHEEDEDFELEDTKKEGKNYIESLTNDEHDKFFELEEVEEKEEDDQNFDDLFNDSKDIEEDLDEEDLEVEKEETNIDDDFGNFDLDDLEKKSELLSAHHKNNEGGEIDFEKEIMDFNPDSNSAPLDHIKQKNNSKTNLVNQTTITQINESIQKLVGAKDVASGVNSFANDSTFTEIATQLMEPKLEKWLNDNLPEIVEKIVREEIKKIIPS